MDTFTLLIVVHLQLRFCSFLGYLLFAMPFSCLLSSHALYRIFSALFGVVRIHDHPPIDSIGSSSNMLPAHTPRYRDLYLNNFFTLCPLLQYWIVCLYCRHLWHIIGLFLYGKTMVSFLSPGIYTVSGSSIKLKVAMNALVLSHLVLINGSRITSLIS